MVYWHSVEKQGDYYIKDAESKEYFNINTSAKMNKRICFWNKKMYIGKLWLIDPDETL